MTGKIIDILVVVMRTKKFMVKKQLNDAAVFCLYYVMVVCVAEQVWQKKYAVESNW